MSDQKERDAMLFGIRRSIRYHDRRKRFFELCQNVTTFIALLCGSATFYSVAQNNQIVTKIFAAVITITSSLNLVIGFTRKAHLHESLKIKFCKLEIEALKAEDISSIRDERLRIEIDEPPKMHILDMLCHNELMLSMGYKRGGDDEELFWSDSWYHHWVAHVIP